jgi:hypothetical protein
MIEQDRQAFPVPMPQPFEEQHFSVVYWARLPEQVPATSLESARRAGHMRGSKLRHVSICSGGHDAGLSEPPQALEEQHFCVSHWASRWGFSAKTVRDWFRDEYGPGILRQPNTGRRSKRDYTTIMISASAAERIYAKRTKAEVIH